MNTISTRIFARVAAATLLLFAAETVSAARSPEVTQVVFVWLKHPESVADQNALMNAARTFRRISGVKRIDVGRALPIGHPDVEKSFDVAVIITFKDQNALAAFETDKRHEQAVEYFLKPLTRRFAVYNIVLAR